MYERSIIERNPWWTSGSVPEELIGINRKEYIGKITERLKDQKILAILGIRRSGKSTLIYQSIKYLLDNGTDPKKIFYINADDFEKPGRANLEEALDFCQQNNMVSLKDIKIYVFIDEIQNIRGWQQLLKKYYDLKYASKFIVSGSSSSLIYKNSSESLAGRISFIDVFPLTFREFLQFNNLEVQKAELQFKSLEQMYYRLSPKINEIAGFLSQYLNVGGFPEWFDIKNEETWFKILSEEYTSLLIYRDIVRIFRIRDPLLLESVFRFVSAHSSERFSYLGIAKQNDGDKETSKQYVFHLARSHLINLSDFYTKSKKASERKEKKIYFCDMGLKNSIGGRQDIGFDAETCVYLHCLKHVSGYPMGKIFYWLDKKKNETDIIMSYGSELIPVEVKYRSSIDDSDLKGILGFCHDFSVKNAYVVTKTLMEEREIDGVMVSFIPLWLFLLVF
ncbi:MAG: Archaeal ATPase [Candidatus Methanoperedens nitroreducens]|uniref:Archaeal ATPase n=1 Tax=Candidatus Methanoperedens nitratireducens TaxID=1392998 RepID=A0A0P8ACF0_9EURY|nr:ATP-binding protein [Candidatus Methanoperedens sp. BLZ2]KAB2947114.1 MAG: ATP-binding protein [Candidatus Methanoperedens sp.]KPQ44427.1 MAG: Archaeal ATPase [Candidatus Methanoperedens sp. BLZ1]MBZ0174211.1 ATP-binding protein [Candidatus Methanoperedens nitroreducens]MCX9077729.1 ATP-binding protein [Candidatus Methanoperedens sp.]MCX9086401.1 ATP-binding protein [Candidatus Methanoperedens sp.]